MCRGREGGGDGGGEAQGLRTRDGRGDGKEAVPSLPPSAEKGTQRGLSVCRPGMHVYVCCA